MVQFLVYIFMSLFSVAISFVTYFGLTFTTIEAFLAGFVAFALAFIFYERTLRKRAEGRLEKGIEDLSALLSTNAAAGKMLSKRINEITKEETSTRLDVVEADLSVFGTLIREVAEAVTQIEEAQVDGVEVESTTKKNTEIKKDIIVEKQPSIPIADVKKAMKEGRIIYNVQPIVNLPQREVIAYDFLAQMKADNNKLIASQEFIPTKGNEALVREIEQIGFVMAFSYAKQNQDDEKQVLFYVPVSKASLNDKSMLEWLLGQLDISREMAKRISFVISEKQWIELIGAEKLKLASLVGKGAAVSISGANSLRHDFGGLKKDGISSIRANAKIFIDKPQQYSDYQNSDVADYIHRYGIDLIIDDVKTEDQVLSLLEIGVKMIAGDYIAPAGSAIDIIEIGDKSDQSMWAVN